MSILTQVIQERQQWADTRRRSYTICELRRILLEGGALACMTLGFYLYKEEILHFLSQFLV